MINQGSGAFPDKIPSAFPITNLKISFKARPVYPEAFLDILSQTSNPIFAYRTEGNPGNMIRCAALRNHLRGGYSMAQNENYACVACNEAFSETDPRISGELFCPTCNGRLEKEAPIMSSGIRDCKSLRSQ